MSWEIQKQLPSQAGKIHIYHFTFRVITFLLVGEGTLQQNYAKKILSLNQAAWQKETPYFSAWGSHRSDELLGVIPSS